MERTSGFNKNGKGSSILKTYALSKLNYVPLLIVIPKWVISEVKMSFEFIWRGKYRIKTNILYQNYGFEGIMWPKRLICGGKDSA